MDPTSDEEADEEEAEDESDEEQATPESKYPVNVDWTLTVLTSENKFDVPSNIGNSLDLTGLGFGSSPAIFW